jgi:hypothetical protein
MSFRYFAGESRELAEPDLQNSDKQEGRVFGPPFLAFAPKSSIGWILQK